MGNVFIQLVENFYFIAIDENVLEENGISVKKD
jgi:hypothetical protein